MHRTIKAGKKVGQKEKSVKYSSKMFTAYAGQIDLHLPVIEKNSDRQETVLSIRHQPRMQQKRRFSPAPQPFSHLHELPRKDIDFSER